MDELELLKKDWKQHDLSHKKVTSEEIYPMLQKKSSSIVKTLFYISIVELGLWIIINFLPLNNQLNDFYENDIFLNALSIIPFIIVALFIYLLYKAYKSISATDSTKKLMENILKTRKIIKYYVATNLVMFFVIFLITLYYTLSKNPEMLEQLNINDSSNLTAFIVKIALLLCVFIGLFWGVYQLVYGILLKRLNKNYKELKKMEA